MQSNKEDKYSYWKITFECYAVLKKTWLETFHWEVLQWPDKLQWLSSWVISTQFCESSNPLPSHPVHWPVPSMSNQSLYSPFSLCSFCSLWGSQWLSVIQRLTHQLSSASQTWEKTLILKILTSSIHRDTIHNIILQDSKQSNFL